MLYRGRSCNNLLWVPLCNCHKVRIKLSQSYTIDKLPDFMSSMYFSAVISPYYSTLLY